MIAPVARFSVGQIVSHVRYGYRGVVVAFDLRCQADDDWYQGNRTQPGRDQPWYHVLVDGGTHTTYAAETSLTDAPDETPVVHPLVPAYFSGFEDGRHVRNDREWPV